MKEGSSNGRDEFAKKKEKADKEANFLTTNLGYHISGEYLPVSYNLIKRIHQGSVQLFAF